MQSETNSFARRILLVDDNAAIHQDFRKIFAPSLASDPALSASTAALFGAEEEPPPASAFIIDFALQGLEGVANVRRALEERRPYAVAFVDMRMPPGWDGLETIRRIWEVDADVQIVICTAYSDYTWQQTLKKLGHVDRFVVLKKPFDAIEVQQLAEMLTERWRLGRQERGRLQDLERRIQEHHRDLQAIQSINAQLDAANRRLTAAQDPQADTQLRSRRELERDLRRGLQAGELSVHYQPIVEIGSRRVVGLEALARWQHPTRGWVSPGEFIPLAEECGLIVPLGEQVLRLVCEQVVRWQRDNVPVVRVAVNVSSVQIEQQPLWELIRSVMRETGLQPHQLALELTEGTLVKNAAKHARALQGLRDDGVEIEIDDFGTGYSSLSYLKQLPLDAIKIDRSFIRQLDTNSSDEAIVAAILALARGLNLRVVAEGVETPGQLQVLARHGCELAQGFYFSRPLPADECSVLLCELAERTSFTDTLRLRIVRSQDMADGTPVGPARLDTDAKSAT